MKKTLTALTASVALANIGYAQINIIPKPNQVQEIKDVQFKLSAETGIRYDAKLQTEAELLQAAIKNATGLELKLVDENAKILLPSQIHLDLNDKGGKKESYTLSVKDKSITLTGADNAGAFYASQSLLQLIPLDGSNKIPGCSISDAPRFGWRGMHLDVGRHMFEVKDIKKFIDWLAVHKLNSFHWHLTEDQGWRIEIKKYPKLTEIGGFRKSTPPYLDRWGSDGKRYGGFYTQEQIKEVVAYAKARHINVLPEIDMPGHMAAAIAAYPHLGNDDIKDYKPEVKIVWGIHTYTLSPKETTFEWIDDVLTEVCELFPSRYIHIGGDEAPKNQWKKSKFAQEVIKREGLKDEHELQSYMIKRIEKILEAKGRKLIGWDEIREGGLSPNATMMLWRGWNHAIDSINEGHDVVMGPGSHTYFDHYQNYSFLELKKGKEFECIGGFRPLDSVYTFDPVPEQFLGTDKEKHVLGCQGQLWTEYMKTWDKVEYCGFPRISALAECAWTETKNKNYDDFYARLQPMLKRFEKAGINYFDPNKAEQLKPKDGVTVTTSFKAPKTPAFTVYDGYPESTFWSGESLKVDDHITIAFPEAKGNFEIVVKSGSEDKKRPSGIKDIVEQGVLEAKTGGKWTKIADFKEGKASAAISSPVEAVRLRATKNQKDWLFLNEIEITSK